jgi:hypothetical protein
MPIAIPIYHGIGVGVGIAIDYLLYAVRLNCCKLSGKLAMIFLL